MQIYFNVDDVSDAVADAKNIAVVGSSVGQSDAVKYHCLHKNVCQSCCYVVEDTICVPA